MNSNEENPIIIHKTSSDIVKKLKKSLKSYKRLIKDNTSRDQYFPFVGLNPCPKLDKICSDVQSKGYNDSIDNQINKICKKLNNKTNDCVFTETQTNPKIKRKFTETVIEFNAIIDEELDFEEEVNKCYKTDLKTNTQDNKTHKLNGFPKKLNSNHSRNGYKYETNGSKAESTNGLPIFQNLSNEINFKIPKKDFKNIESIVSQANDLKTQKRFVDSFNHLTRYLNEEQWQREDVLELLASNAKGMANNNDFGTNITKFNDLIDKIKSLQYIDDDFWDQLIWIADKKKNDNKKSHLTQINLFLASLYDYLMDNKITARVLCTEAVIIALRLQTNHPSAKDLIDYYKN